MPSPLETDYILHALGYLHGYFGGSQDGYGPNTNWLIEKIAKDETLAWSVARLGRIFTDAAHIATERREAEPPEPPMLPFMADQG